MNFVVVFPAAENVHLIKDVGMIPYVLHKEYSCNSFLASYRNNDLPYLESAVFGLKHINIPAICSKAAINAAVFLLLNSSKIDVLNVYHLTKASLLWINIYKSIRRTGKVYLKFDTNLKVAEQLLQEPKTRKALQKVFEKCDLISCETFDVKKLFEDQLHCSIRRLPNGVLEKEIKIEPSKKERIILAVGRLGTSPKNTELLIDAFAEAVPAIEKDWKLYLVGAATPEFLEYVGAIMEKHHLGDRIILKGNIEDRQKLEAIYERSTIFAMPSRWEGFSLASVEALARGCYLLATDLQCFREMTCNGKYGTLCKNEDETDYSQKLISVCRKIEKGEKIVDYDEMRTYVHNFYSWERICGEIYDAIGK